MIYPTFLNWFTNKRFVVCVLFFSVALVASGNSLKYVFKQNSIMPGMPTEAVEFFKDSPGLWYPDNSPTGNAVIIYETGSGLSFNNGRIPFQESQTAFYFHRLGLDGRQDFSFSVVSEIPEIYTDFTPGQVLSLDIGFFYGTELNPYDKQFMVAYGVANVPEVQVSGRIALLDGAGIFELEDIPGNPVYCKTSIEFSSSKLDFIITQQFFSDIADSPIVVHEKTDSIPLSSLFKEIPSDMTFIPFIQFNSENLAVGSEAMPLIVAAEFSDHSDTGSGGGGEPVAAIPDSDSDGIPDIIEKFIGLDPTVGDSLSVLSKRLESLTVLENSEIIDLRNNGLLIETSPESNTFDLQLDLQYSENLDDWFPLDSTGIKIDAPVNGVRFYRLSR